MSFCLSSSSIISLSAPFSETIFSSYCFLSNLNFIIFNALLSLISSSVYTLSVTSSFISISCCSEYLPSTFWFSRSVSWAFSCIWSSKLSFYFSSPIYSSLSSIMGDPSAAPNGEISFKKLPLPAALGLPFLGKTRITPFFLQQKHSAVFSAQSSHSQKIDGCFLAVRSDDLSGNSFILHCSWKDRWQYL